MLSFSQENQNEFVNRPREGANQKNKRYQVMEARAVRLAGEPVTDVNATLASLTIPTVLEVGKKIIVKLVP